MTAQEIGAPSLTYPRVAVLAMIAPLAAAGTMSFPLITALLKTP